MPDIDRINLGCRNSGVGCQPDGLLAGGEGVGLGPLQPPERRLMAVGAFAALPGPVVGASVGVELADVEPNHLAWARSPNLGGVVAIGLKPSSAAETGLEAGTVA
jgi:hypothetical protein